MSEKVKPEQEVKNNEKKNITKAKSLTHKSIMRNSQTPLKVQSNNKIFINNNSNTMINPSNNYNINNNISININIDMTNERNKSFNLKNKSQTKKNPMDANKVQYSVNNNSLVFNKLKNFANKPNPKKSPFHIRIKSANLGVKDSKFKPTENPRNKVYQNRLNYYYNISNKNNFNIFSHKFENKKQENMTDNEKKKATLNKTPIKEETNKIYKNLRDNQNKNNEKIISMIIAEQQNKKKNINKNVNKNINNNKYVKKRNFFSPMNKEPLNKTKTKNKNKSTTPNHSNSHTQLNSSIDNRKINLKNNKISSNKNDKINYRNKGTSPFIHSQKVINNTANYDKKNKNKVNKNPNMFKSPVNYKYNNSIFKNKNNSSSNGKNNKNPTVNNKSVSHVNKINKPTIQKENKIINNNNPNLKEKEEKKEDIIKVNKETSEPIKAEEEKEKENVNIDAKQKENLPEENTKKDSSIQINMEEKETPIVIINDEKKEELKEEEKKESNVNIDKEEEIKIEPIANKDKEEEIKEESNTNKDKEEEIKEELNVNKDKDKEVEIKIEPIANKDKEEEIKIEPIANKDKEEEIKEELNVNKDKDKEEEIKIEPIANKDKEEENTILKPPKSESDIAALFLNELFQNSFPLEIPSTSTNPPKKEITQLESICKVGYSGPGVKKKNQDNFFIYKHFINDKDTIFLGVCDGHGMFGHDISSYLVNVLPKNLNSAFIKENITTVNNDSDFQKIIDITSNVFVQTNLNLVNDSSIDCTYSGTTCSSLIFSSEKIISINVGDSRCVLGKCINDKWSALNLTRDHKPTEEEEKKRIIDKGGRIEPYKDDSGEAVGPERVWLKGEDLPGLAMSRSFGDDVAHTIGVTSKPEIMEFKLNEEDKFILLASDGIFEFISSDEAVNMVKDYYLKDDIKGALNYLYKVSSQRWIMEEEVIDDITLIIMFLK